jgi:hypothetical protein
MCLKHFIHRCKRPRSWRRPTPAASALRQSTLALEARSLRGRRREAEASQVVEMVSEAHDLPPRFSHGEECCEGYNLWAVSATAGSPILYGRFRPMLGTRRGSQHWPSEVSHNDDSGACRRPQTMHAAFGRPCLLGQLAHALYGVLIKTVENPRAFVPKAQVGLCSEG